MACVAWWGGSLIAPSFGIDLGASLNAQPDGGKFFIVFLVLSALAMLAGWALGHGLVAIGLRLSGESWQRAIDVVFRAQYPDAWKKNGSGSN